MAKPFITGDKQAIRAFEKLDKKIQRKSLRRAGGKAAVPVRKEMKARARKVSNTIAKGIGTKNKVYLKDYTGIVVLGVVNKPTVIRPVVHTGPAGEATFVRHDPRKTFHLVDLGTKGHNIKVYGKHEKWHPGTPPANIREGALNSKEHVAVAIYKTIFRQEVLAGASVKA